MSRFGVLALVALTALASPAAGQALEREARPASVRERVFAEHLGRSLGGRNRAQSVRWRDGERVVAQGVRVRLSGLEVERLRFRDSAAAEAFARRAAAAGQVAEVRGAQALVLSGPRLGERELARQARAAGWDVLPAPPGEVRVFGADSPARQTDRAKQPRTQRQEAPQQRAPEQGGHGAAELLGHYLNGEALGEPVARPARDALAADVAGALASEASREAMGEHQRQRVQPAFEALSPAEQAAFEELLAQAGSPAEQAQLLKALAAGNDLPVLGEFAARIRGQDEGWLERNLRLTGSDRDERGIRQQFHDTCGVTTVQAMRGAYDPVYALRVRDENGDVTRANDADAYDPSFNPDLAAEQQALTEAPYEGTTFEPHEGVAVPRSALGGGGRWVDDQLNELEPSTGLRYTTLLDPTPGEASEVLREQLEAGRLVPVVVGGDVGEYAHYVLAINVRADPAGGRSFQLHDPWDGRTSWVSERSILDGTLWINEEIAAYDTITALEVPAPGDGG